MGRAAVERGIPVAGGEARWSGFIVAGELVGPPNGEVAGESTGIIARGAEAQADQEDVHAGVLQYALALRGLTEQHFFLARNLLQTDLPVSSH